MISNGAQTGPFSLDEMRMKGISPDTMVWHQGLTDWVRADSVPELREVLDSGSAFGAYSEAPVVPPSQPAPYDGQGGSIGNGGNLGRGGYHRNWLPLSIVATVVGALFSCLGLIFGVIAIVNSSKANKLYEAGRDSLGDVKNSTARTMCIIALVLGLLGLGISFTSIPEMLQSRLTELYNLPL